MSLFVTPAPLVFDPRQSFSLLDAPSSPSVYDDEFTATSLDAKWTLVSDTTTFDNVNDIDAYAGFSSGHRTSHNNYRRSWFMAQPASVGFMFIHQTVSLPSECFIWYRAGFSYRYVGQTNNDHGIGLILGQLASGVPSPTNQIYCFLNESDTDTVQAQGGCIISSVDTSSVTRDVGAQSVGSDALSQHFEFAGIQKLGTTYHSFAGTGTGNWVHIRSVTYAGTVDKLAIRFGNASTASPGNMIMGLDFVRMVSGRFLP